MDGQTDIQTDRLAISISRVSMLTRDKNYRAKGVLDNPPMQCVLCEDSG